MLYMHHKVPHGLLGPVTWVSQEAVGTVHMGRGSQTSYSPVLLVDGQEEVDVKHFRHTQLLEIVQKHMYHAVLGF